MNIKKVNVNGYEIRIVEKFVRIAPFYIASIWDDQLLIHFPAIDETSALMLALKYMEGKKILYNHTKESDINLKVF
ncbi:hypothetical protein UFOVP153_33 [uncultured Caudovirales phage]|uniref:Uncharacterized protein n=1 Tax=uncultured Caudovirales phage TaxID=2100421 RepID=A0A6J5KYA6_9CAUD|nr:hypothetical protein UFOVP69_25 [uncultured Caudovirales phage]CAB5170655.1 hypothetical protein UFOVP153_33 [uncultured Caudovirales phage]